MRFVSFAAIALASSPAQARDTEAASQDAAEIARDYWRARVLARHASNRSCSIENFPQYEDPASPFRRNDERMRRIERELDGRHSGIVMSSRPRTPFPPPQLLCDAEADARRALEDYDAQVIKLEQRLGLTREGER